MWCPEGYYSWFEVVESIQSTTSKILTLATTECRLVMPSRSNTHHYLAEAALHSNGIEDFKKAELNLAITTTFLVVNFLDIFRPILANLDGRRIVPEWPLISHRDQFELCVFVWPLEADSQYRSFFEYQENNGFSRSSLLDRFAYIDPYTGRLRNKNGSRNFLENGVGLEPETAGAFESLAQKLSDFVLCWSEIPQDEEWRDFFSILDVNESFHDVLNNLLGPPPDFEISRKKIRPRGRPKQRDQLADVYFELFPDGHETLGKSWKEVTRAVEEKIGRTVVEYTLKQGVKERR